MQFSEDWEDAVSANGVSLADVVAAIPEESLKAIEDVDEFGRIYMAEWLTLSSGKKFRVWRTLDPRKCVYGFTVDGVALWPSLQQAVNALFDTTPLDAPVFSGEDHLYDYLGCWITPDGIFCHSLIDVETEGSLTPGTILVRIERKGVTERFEEVTITSEMIQAAQTLSAFKRVFTTATGDTVSTESIKALLNAETGDVLRREKHRIRPTVITYVRVTDNLRQWVRTWTS